MHCAQMRNGQKIICVRVVWCNGSTLGFKRCGSIPCATSRQTRRKNPSGDSESDVKAPSKADVNTLL